ncbi:hypothetical protein SCLCIDRAFT_1185636 [Scleroderma citrinum Foug A]|uniref:DNAJ-containing protein X-domain domain-containing protein n=1 Tax=Scleroderma citrinum Foug A TaxID=1036808 RepID=A0A0C3DGI6_9AGAM|nr:hypothetical protein SCLCIDRAFT_1185636 [Scleroderma citrinum Foug A]
MSNSALCSHVDALEAMLRKRIALDADGLTPWEVLPFEKRKIECDAELSSKSLGIMSMVQEVKMLQGVLDTTTGLEEKWALEEDIIGKILWICWCGIHAEVGQVLPQALDHIVNDETVASELRNVRPWYIGNIFEEAAANPPDDIQAHLLRVMADAEARVSKYQLLLAEKAVR